MKLNRIGIAFAATIGLAHSQAAQPATPLAFEVASVKPTDPAFTGRTLRMPPDDGMVTIRGWSLKELILFAWGSGTGLHPSLISSGGPSWFDHDRYDIIAKPEGPRIPSQDQRKLMLKALLVERFRLKFHNEPKNTAVYALVVGKNGPRMKERKPDDGGSPFSLLLNGFQLPGRNASMAQLADILQALIPRTDPERENRPVVDKTGLTGRFDFDLTWAPDLPLSGGRGGATDFASVPDIFTAVQEQLGLKLEPQKASMEILIIDHIERPTQN
jgi:uncharacterized protein (TIGR03435 family)